MTEEQWLREIKAAQPMLLHLSQLGVQHTKSGRRKLRLFACGCCRLVWRDLPDNKFRSAVESSEQVADGKAGDDRLGAARNRIVQMAAEWGVGSKLPQVRLAVAMAVAATDPSPLDAALVMTDIWVEQDVPDVVTKFAICDLLRCIFGNPFQPVTAEPSWRTPAAASVARDMYVRGKFEDLPILGDAFEEAGCTDAALLEHCRERGRHHARGCWAVDLALANE